MIGAAGTLSPFWGSAFAFPQFVPRLHKCDQITCIYASENLAVRVGHAAIDAQGLRASAFHNATSTFVGKSPDRRHMCWYLWSHIMCCSRRRSRLWKLPASPRSAVQTCLSPATFSTVIWVRRRIALGHQAFGCNPANLRQPQVRPGKPMRQPERSLRCPGSVRSRLLARRESVKTMDITTK